jgi:DNA repair protein RadA/Sms
VCQTCASVFLRWEGQCRNCDAWNSLVETIVRDEPRPRPGGATVLGARSSTPAALRDLTDASVARLPTGLGEIDRVLGGGLVPGSVVLVGGEPGVGKSTLLLQLAAGLIDAAGVGVLYASGEESTGQVRLRATRLGLLDRAAGDRLRVVAETEVGRVVEIAREERPALVIVDSIQTATVDELDGPPGSVGQVRECALRLTELAKGDGIAVVLVGHVTKEGSLAGPKTLEHLVDAVLSLEGERAAGLRLLRGTKNRFGSTDEVGVFEMAERGLLELSDPARAFMGDLVEAASGSVVAATLEGSRALLVEVQALVTSGGPVPRRTVSGLDPNRLALLIAVLGRRAGIGLASHDVYANLAGGLRVDDPALDLPLALALASSLRDRPVRPGTVALGEVGLLGELRPVAGLERRLREAARLGFERAIIPARGITGAEAREGQVSRAVTEPRADGLTLVPVATLRDALGAALVASGTPDPDARLASAAAM